MCIIREGIEGLEMFEMSEDGLGQKQWFHGDTFQHTINKYMLYTNLNILDIGYTAIVVLARSFGMRAKPKPRSKIEAGQCRSYIGTATTMEDKETLDVILLYTNEMLLTLLMPRSPSSLSMYPG